MVGTSYLHIHLIYNQLRLRFNYQNLKLCLVVAMNLYQLISNR